jgi:hypothetical protein
MVFLMIAVSYSRFIFKFSTPLPSPQIVIINKYKKLKKIKINKSKDEEA